MDSENYADLAVFRKSLGDMIDRFLMVHGAYSTQGERDFWAAAPPDSMIYESERARKRRFRKLVRRGKKLLRARGWTWEPGAGIAILAAARAWERAECGPMWGRVSWAGLHAISAGVPVLELPPKSS